MADTKAQNTSADQLITEHLDIWTTAIDQKSSSGRGSSKKFSLYGIKKLRELILELAVRGKLVPQDPNNEPAAKLLERIAAEKAQLIKDKKIKKQKQLPAISEGEQLLPKGWSTSYMQDITKVVTCGMASTPKYKEEGRIFLSAKNVKPNKFMPEEHKFVDEETFKKVTQNANPEKGDILLTRVGAGIGEAAVVDIEIEFAFYVSLTLLKPFQNHLNSNFLLLWLNSPQGTKKSIDNIYGRGVSAGNLNVNQVRGFVVPIPPLEEQQSIVAKADELMGLCDALEAQTENSIAAHQTLVEVLLEALLKSPEQTATPEQAAKQFQQNWQRLSEHFDTLFTTTASIDTLKQTILQLAVMGKLVPQNPNDEPADKLLERIAAEKAQLIKDKKIKKQKLLPEITNEEKPFELAQGWEWCRFDDAALSSSAGWSPQCLPTPRNGEDWGVLKVSAVTWGIFNPEENKELPAHLEPRIEHEVQSGDFLISRANTADLVAKAVIVPDFAPKNLMMSDKIIRFKLHGSVSGEYLNLMNNSQVSRDYYNRVAGGTSSSMKNVSREQIRSLVVALPPQEEQQRIVTKVDELMTLCDQLKVSLTDAQTTKLHLTNVLVENAISKGKTHDH